MLGRKPPWPPWVEFYESLPASWLFLPLGRRVWPVEFSSPCPKELSGSWRPPLAGWRVRSEPLLLGWISTRLSGWCLISLLLPAIPVAIRSFSLNSWTFAWSLGEETLFLQQLHLFLNQRVPLRLNSKPTIKRKATTHAITIPAIPPLERPSSSLSSETGSVQLRR